jgi:hypothetical protein
LSKAQTAPVKTCSQIEIATEEESIKTNIISGSMLAAVAIALALNGAAMTPAVAKHKAYHHKMHCGAKAKCNAYKHHCHMKVK